MAPMLALKLVLIIVVLTVEIAVQAAVATPANASSVYLIVIAVQILMGDLVFVLKLIMPTVMSATQRHLPKLQQQPQR
ncbi:MAG: hypothetical protein NTU75_00135 [Sphingomonadales bacterium]|nr:hypothetical protein [Sphingomonadales bacterium]